jgi:hypothetical protein
MANSTKDSRNEISLEELLRFKKAERPNQDFWKDFDSELHQRMMQTLVKKDAWHVQIMRGLSGKLAQTAAIAAAAAVMALMVIRPAFVAPGASEPTSPTVAAVEAEKSTAVEETRETPDAALMADADYEIEMLSASTADAENSAVTQDYGLDHIEVASYDSDAYSADMGLPGFTSTGVASLVY